MDIDILKKGLQLCLKSVLCGKNKSAHAEVSNNTEQSKIYIGTVTPQWKKSLRNLLDQNQAAVRIEKDGKNPFLQPLWKAKYSACSFCCRILHYGHSRLREHWTWKPENHYPLPRTMTTLKQELWLLHSHTYTQAMPLHINQLKLKQKPGFTHQYQMGLYWYQKCSQW